jgi:tetratricopeptide (TPR) repeat protein
MHTHKSRLTNQIFICVLILAMMVTPVLDCVVPLLARPQEKCSVELTEAESKYQEGQLDEAIALVRRCLDKDDITLEESERAYKLIGKAYHAKGLLAESKENLRKLLKLIPNWRPNPDIETPSFLRLADEVIKEMEAEKAKEALPVIAEPKKEEPKVEPPVKKGGGKKFIFIGGAGVAAAAVAVIFLLSGGGDKQLPGPPPLPQ